MSLEDAPGLYLSFASLHVVLGHLGSSALYWLRFKKSPLALYRPESSPSAHRRITRLVSLASLAWAAALIATAFSPGLRASEPGRALFPIPALVGWVVAVLGLLLMVVAQASMGDVFRIGQDESDPPGELQRRGLHAISRNPIYVGSWGCLLGMTLWHPSEMLLTLVAMIAAGIHALVMAEELFLRERFGEAFVAYCRRTPRYLGLPRGES